MSFISCMHVKKDPRVYNAVQSCITKNISSIVIKENPTVNDIQREWVSKFELNNISEPETSVRYIIEHVIGITKVQNANCAPL